MVLFILAILVLLIIQGCTYYLLPMEERFFHAGHDSLKPGGVWGHDVGMQSSLAILPGVTLYIMWKRASRMAGNYMSGAILLAYLLR